MHLPERLIHECQEPAEGVDMSSNVGANWGNADEATEMLAPPVIVRIFPFLALAAWIASLIGTCVNCLNNDDTAAPMTDKGLIIILPGIQGIDYHHVNIRAGLRGSGIPCAIKINAWGSQIPGVKLAINETDARVNRSWAGRIAAEIRDYQSQHPGRPVYLIGQSGGAAVAVFAAESLAQAGAGPIEGVVLLSASLSTDYDLTAALGQCRKGIVNFYNPRDMTLLEVGTAIFGNLDGSRGDSAGRTGFQVPYHTLYQVNVTADMVHRFSSPHFANTSAAFTSQYIAPWLMDGNWPAAPDAAG